MSELIRILGIGISGGAVTVLLRRYNSVYGMLTALAVGTYMLLSLCDMTGEVISELYKTVATGGIDSGYIQVVVKVIGIAYLSDFGAQILRDSGEGAIASKCELAGKIFILYLTFPVVADFIKMCVKIAEAL